MGANHNFHAPVFILFSIMAVGLCDRHAIAGEERRRIVPLIRAYTDCLAGAIRTNAAWLSAAKDGRWPEAYGPASKLCEDAGVGMVVAHEHVYGRGTGIPFLKGSYLDDLPRALTARLQSDFDRLAAEERAAGEREVQRETALAEKKKLVAEAVTVHEHCVVQALADTIPYSTENAPTLADVALSKCATFAERRITIGIAAFGMTRDEAAGIVATKVSEMRSKIIETIVTSRAELAKRQQRPPQDAGEGLPKAQPL